VSTSPKVKARRPFCPHASMTDGHVCAAEGRHHSRGGCEPSVAGLLGLGLCGLRSLTARPRPAPSGASRLAGERNSRCASSWWENRASASRHHAAFDGSERSEPIRHCHWHREESDFTHGYCGCRSRVARFSRTIFSAWLTRLAR